MMTQKLYIEKGLRVDILHRRKTGEGCRAKVCRENYTGDVVKTTFLEPQW